MAAVGSFLSGMGNGFFAGRSITDRKADLALREKELANRNSGGAAQRSVLGGATGPNLSSSQSGAGRSLNLSGGISENARSAYQRLTSNGVSPVMASALVGNMMQESGAGLNTGAVGDNGNAYGAGQWNGPRKRAYLDFAQSRGSNPDDLNTQVDFLLHEGQTSEKSAWQAIMSANDPQEAARIASNKFWRPGVPHTENRMAYAQKIYDALGQQPTHETSGRSIVDGMGTGDYMVARYGGGR
ncbi:hypothetical protein DL1_08445 [Thioclava dalianensis]|uniref:Phage tail lysozyme domain-containing protein n=1 Tax=Thioclava dalianensis TaxID=1185766 RepID=A0A074U2E5_9RHOB|nr:phage tail tip lysozyme [Thioclava dalianensis]KEP68807.1 hypothetical protein DL1_08445 [Thioclava dalianensis]SFN50420.1 hypothetical protein SAMN05216224_10699 [Thioclava dalianensis]